MTALRPLNHSPAPRCLSSQARARRLGAGAPALVHHLGLARPVRPCRVAPGEIVLAVALDVVLAHLEHAPAFELDVIDGEAAEVGQVLDRASGAVEGLAVALVSVLALGRVAREVDLLGPHRDRDRHAGDAVADVVLDVAAIDDAVIGLVGDERAVHQVDVADEVRDEARRRCLVDVGRRPDLQHLALAHDGDARGHRHRLFLVVRHHDAGHAHVLDDVDELDLRLLAQLLVQRAQRLVEQQHLRPLGQAARKRNALLLPAGELMGLPLAELAQLHELQHRLDALLDRALGHAVAPQAEGDVVPHREVREQRVGLEHHVERALVGHQPGDVLALEQYASRGRRLEAREHAQQRRLAAARRAEQGEDLAFGDVDADVVDGDGAATEVLDHILDAQEGRGVGSSGGRGGAAHA
jgi:hypothetical protein